ncbi:MAG TPA: LapA family protein [Dehalococcoidia bacterium]|jgi:uncharacterized integral membrane protein|nr:LapA family protein [Dehalococcoidia bacterium]
MVEHGAEDGELRAGEHRHTGIGARTVSRLIAAAVVLAAFLVFVFQNERIVRIHFLVWQVNAHLAWALVIAGAFGLVIGLLSPRLRRLL